MEGQVVSPHTVLLVVSNVLLCFLFNIHLGSAAAFKNNCVQNGKRRGIQGDGRQTSIKAQQPAMAQQPSARVLTGIPQAPYYFVIRGLVLVIYYVACTP